MPRISSLSSIALALSLLLAACGPRKPEGIGFAAPGTVDFDRLEREHPLTAEARAALDPGNLPAFDQSELDQIYARLSAGPIPDGAYRGTIIFAAGGGPKKLSARLGPLTGRLADLKIDRLDAVGEALWKGKVFYRDQRVLRNMIEHERVVGRLFDVAPDAMRRERIDGREVALLFPASLSCGESLLDPRRSSVIIDYADTDRIAGYLPEIDFLAGREGLRVRDEIRLVRDGLYLGRAYARDRFLLNFTLSSEEKAESGGEPAAPCADRPEPAGADPIETATGSDPGTPEPQAPPRG